ncbi:hypothetical protein ACFTTN_17990 [Streptomyces niveus]|uniref:hypothetical protein n=1 Tax=Streptomyces niveus TaxID=193462 RepID=UPI00363D38AD
MTSSLSRELAAGRPAEVEDVLSDLIRRGRTPRLEAAALTPRVHNQCPSAAPKP